ncbi:hypothetical protein PR048_017400 [Dryococelus australis]|uniref:Uncharacterized protein n=1 Tax=Dryococelus australis TaxID=614101 RepID=A0ABQ9H9H1_9NEOP|nr:hypothetical protein PR048_017400 [Dryococelus australis]
MFLSLRIYSIARSAREEVREQRSTCSIRRWRHWPRAPNEPCRSTPRSARGPLCRSLISMLSRKHRQQLSCAVERSAGPPPTYKGRGSSPVHSSPGPRAERLACSPPNKANRPGLSGYSHVGIIPDDAAGRRVFFWGGGGGRPFPPSPLIPALLRTHLNHPQRPLTTSLHRFPHSPYGVETYTHLESSGVLYPLHFEVAQAAECNVAAGIAERVCTDPLLGNPDSTCAVRIDPLPFPSYQMTQWGLITAMNNARGLPAPMTPPDDPLRETVPSSPRARVFPFRWFTVPPARGATMQPPGPFCSKSCFLSFPEV